MAQLKELQEPSDISFVVDGEEFYGHKNVAALRAPALFDLATNGKDTLELSGISKEDFESIFSYMYTEQLPRDTLDLDSLLDLLKQADRFACTSLKLELEAQLVEHFLDDSNAIRFLSLSHSHN